jgi:hypothetical protein
LIAFSIISSVISSCRRFPGTDSLFEHLNARKDKEDAIWVWTMKSGSSVVSTSFFDVKVNASQTICGGAMYFDDSPGTIYQCCGNACDSDDDGLFLGLADEGNHRIGDTSIVLSETKNYDGTVDGEPNLGDASCSVELSSVFTMTQEKNRVHVFF